MLRQQAKHRYPCRDRDCKSPLCEAYWAGYWDGYQDGRGEGGDGS